MPAYKIEKHTKETLVTKLGEVLESWPLYRAFNYEGDSLHPDVSQSREPYHFGTLPTKIRLFCEGKDCQNVQLWGLDGSAEMRVPAQFGRRTYTCQNCGGYSVTYAFDWAITRDSGFFQKVGQAPPLAHIPPKELRRRLDDEDYGLYVKALDCRNFNYGLGAVAYMRRVVENKTNDLLDLILDTLRAEGTSTAEHVGEIEEIKKGIVYEKKLDIAQKLLPTRLVREGSNPIQNLHTLTSMGLHERSEDECINIFDQARVAFEYIFSQLEVERASAEEYVKTIRELNQKVK